MRIFFFILLFLLCGCGKKNSKPSTDSETAPADTNPMPVPIQLSFGELHNLTLKPDQASQDSLSVQMFNSLHELEKRFHISDTDNTLISNLTINRVVGFFCSPSLGVSDIEIEKIELATDDINVFVNLSFDNTSTDKTTFKVYAIERRDGYSSLQFIVNNKVMKSISLLAPKI